MFVDKQNDIVIVNKCWIVIYKFSLKLCVDCIFFQIVINYFPCTCTYNMLLII